MTSTGICVTRSSRYLRQVPPHRTACRLVSVLDILRDLPSSLLDWYPSVSPVDPNMDPNS